MFEVYGGQVKKIRDHSIKKGHIISVLKIKINRLDANLAKEKYFELFDSLFNCISSNSRKRMDSVYVLNNNNFLVFLGNCNLKNGEKFFERIHREMKKIKANWDYSADFFEIRPNRRFSEEQFLSFLEKDN